MSDKEQPDTVRRFRSMNGSIYSNNPSAFEPKVVTTRVRLLLNDLYAELAKHDRAAAERICKQYNA